MENLLTLADVAIAQGKLKIQPVKFKCPSCRIDVEVFSPYFDGQVYYLKCVSCQVSFRKIFVPVDTKLLTAKRLLGFAKRNLPKELYIKYRFIIQKFIEPRQTNVQRCRRLQSLACLLAGYDEVLYTTVKYLEMCLDNLVC